LLFVSQELKTQGHIGMVTNHTVLASHMKWQLMFDVAEFYGLMDLGQVRSVAMVLQWLMSSSVFVFNLYILVTAHQQVLVRE
jgi:hypothetical protein